MTNNQWHSIDTRFQDGVWMVLQPDLPINKGNNSYVAIGNVSAV
jgi:hypothetical protein